MTEPVIEPQPGGGAPDPNAPPGTPAGQEGSKGAGGDGRTLENVRGELLRKHKDLDTKVSQLLDGINELKSRFGAPAPQQNQPGYVAPQAPPAVPNPIASPYGAPRALASYNDDALQAALVSPSIPDYQKSVIRVELDTRVQERRIDQAIEHRQRQERVNSLKVQSDKAAKDRYPALRDSDSEFSRRVEAEFQARKQLGETPTSFADAANAVAQEMNVEVSRVTRGFTAAAHNDDAPPASQVESSMTDEQIADIAGRFADSLPTDIDPKTGRPVRRKFKSESIRERAKQYNAAAGALGGRGMRVQGGKA